MLNTWAPRVVEALAITLAVACGASALISIRLGDSANSRLATAYALVHYGTWYIESAIVGNNRRLTCDEALQIVHGYESQSDPDIPALASSQFTSHLMYERWTHLGPSPKYAETVGGDRP